MDFSEFDTHCMHRALELAARGRGLVEPNPMVGCVLANGRAIIGEGFHRRFGEDHAEIDALRHADSPADGCTAYVSLEPCCHHGKTPPCTEALIQAAVGRVVIAMVDPNPQVAGKGIEQLRNAGIEVDVGLAGDEALRLNRPFVTWQTRGRPWVIAKWAMTWDGRIATTTGESQWISNPQSRAVVHQTRSRVDGIAVGSGTVHADDPQLLARLEGESPRRTAARVVFDSRAAIPSGCKLLREVERAPVVVVVSNEAPDDDVKRLRDAGAEVVPTEGDRPARVQQALQAFGRRPMTNLLVEGGGQLLGAFLDADRIDEVHLFLGPRLVGGAAAPGPIAGDGIAQLAHAPRLREVQTDMLQGDIHIRGIVDSSPIQH